MLAPSFHRPAIDHQIGILRYVVESLVLLAVSVVLFRGFAAEGYMISTGSMAPTLLGFHRDVKCPECHFQFARGAWIADDENSLQKRGGEFAEGVDSSEVTRCPNCSYQDISVLQLPRAEGDQLLVHKHAYDFRNPRRWEVVVFRNPEDPSQAYVKRVVGLPGETIELRHGNVYANGELKRKDLATQRSIRLPVSEFRNRPLLDSPDAAPIWQAMANDSLWEQSQSALRYQVKGAIPRDNYDWIVYRHWLLSGGHHISFAPLSAWPANVTAPESQFSRLSYRDGMLRSEGVFTDIERTKWLNRSDSPAFRKAIQQIFERSHLSPIVDDYGYNAYREAPSFPVNEFFVSFDLEHASGDGELIVQITDGENRFLLQIDKSKQALRLLVGEENRVVSEAKFVVSERPLHVEFSTIDSQVRVAINNRELFEAFEYTLPEKSVSILQPVMIGSKNLSFTITGLRIDRDVYYRPIDRSRPQSVTLASDEFYVLGDNSPVSVDSRVWDVSGISRRSLIGKPLIVHLPSKAKWVEVNGQNQSVRVPDFRKVRWIK